jgi:hypothetical protein
MANHRPYADLALDTMEGCYGPASKMETALAGFTPNIPWPEIGCKTVIDEDGQGTSSATPQIAAAAALWIARHREKLAQLPEAWMRGEAVRQALFRSASFGTQLNPDDQLGWGHVRAHAMLDLEPSAAGKLVRAQPASASWAWLKLLTGIGVGFAPVNRPAKRLFGLELMQLAQRDPEVASAIADPDGDGITEAERQRFLQAAEASPLASRALKKVLEATLSKSEPKPPSPPPHLPKPAAPVAATEEAAERRRLRIFALDPSLGGALNSYESQLATIDVRNEASLAPGPVGEYLEVVDVDPASNRFYPPVDLNDRNLLLQDGIAPSEGDPKFHQQMVYAVAMRTIENFETALGRDALWARQWSGKDGEQDKFVQRLRIYPHALRQGNAYYSPQHKALLFGYFPANSRVSDLTPPGTMVFSCLSADVIAHETTHALLDGQARTFREASNPDVRAFHEAFADIVALFQQFTYRDLVRREIAQARGKLAAVSFLGKLARQFGEGMGKAGPLRRYPELEKDLSYETTFGTHDRGSLLVAAVYRAFLAIVERRTEDLVRLATNGSGILPEGAIHPGLAEILTTETTRAARHVLRMCIRAIDYTPPVDITFGEYLRALITADLEHVPVDRFGYRVAFLEAFRRLQLLPRNLRTVSVETLRWHDCPEVHARPSWLEPAVAAMRINITDSLSRRQIFERNEGPTGRRTAMQDAIRSALASQEACDPLGLEFGLKRFRAIDGAPAAGEGTTFMVDNLRVAKRVRDDGKLIGEVFVVLRQRRPELLFEDADPNDKNAERFWYRGGATLVIDLYGEGGPRIRYAVVKPMMGKPTKGLTRLERERRYRRGDAGGTMRSMYFGVSEGRDSFDSQEPFAVIHGSEE